MLCYQVEIENVFQEMHLVGAGARTVRIGTFIVIFELSSVSRRNDRILDVIVRQLSESKRVKSNRGEGTKFIEAAMKAAERFNRGLFLEKCITESGIRLAKRLERLALVTCCKDDPLSYLSVFPSPCASQGSTQFAPCAALAEAIVNFFGVLRR